MEHQAELQETLVMLAFSRQRNVALRVEVEKLRLELEEYKMRETQGITDGDGAD